MRSLSFNIETTDGTARAGVLEVRGRPVRTPVFMPVGTQAAVRATPTWHLPDCGVSIILANTYHLSQRPGERIVAKAGGLHAFMNTDLPILTDSGGFQVFSLKKKSVDDDGVTFHYEVDGRRTRLTPERSMEIQQALGADIAMAFDECLPADVDRRAAETSLARTHRWEARSRTAHSREDQSLFGIVQGGMWGDLRKRSAEEIAAMEFDGYAIGGLAVGEGPEEMNRVLELTTPHMPWDHARYLMGVGRPQDLVDGVERGVDMFDCVIPTRHARGARVYTDRGRMRLTSRQYRRDFYPIDTECGCPTCRSYHRAYLHHLFRVGEIQATTLATIHNLWWFSRFMDRMREAIVQGRFASFARQVREVYAE